ncbi:hypothetical protein PHYSODRAFT_528769, partial [Phytophthora sojae]
MPKSWQLFKAKLRERFRPKDFEYNLRERLFQLKEHGTIHEYVSSFQDLMSQSELGISEMEKRFYFQNGLRAETAKKVKELSPRFLHDVIEIATNFYTAKPQERKPPSKRGPKEDWRKSATCNNCGQFGHIKPQC